jgi:biopolymer transport protein ExbB
MSKLSSLRRISLAAIAVSGAIAPALAFAQAGEAAAPKAGDGAIVHLPTNIIEMAQALGVWVIPFAVLSLVSLWSAVERFIMLRRGRVIPKPFVQRFLALIESGEMHKEEALQICEENDSPIAHIFAHGVRKWGKPSVEVEQAIIDGGERQVASLRANLRVLSGTYTVGPLFGLLGTVWGMLISFDRISRAGAMGNSQQLAAGIALALVTTAAGLAVAIPAIILYMYYSGRIDALVSEMDEQAQRLVNAISAEGLAEQGARTKRPTRDPEASTASTASVAKKRAV